MDKPLVSFYVIAYNQEQYVERAVLGALGQTYGPLQVVLSDDCSTDRTFERMRELAETYRGPHEVVVRRNERNLGVGGHINEVIKACSGEIIVASAGDDWSVSDRVERLMSWWQNRVPQAMLVYSNIIEVDSRGKPLKELDFRKTNPRAVRDSVGTVAWTLRDHIEGRSLPVHGASFAYRREVFESRGPLFDGIVFEDNVLNLRAEILGQVALCPEYLVYHRTHPGQVTNVYGRTMLRRTLEARRKLKWSDVQSLRQNLSDITSLNAPESLRHDLLGRATDWLRERLAVAEGEYKLEFSEWPGRIQHLLVYLLHQMPARLSLRLVVRCLLPDFVYLSVLRLAGGVKRN